MEDKIADGTDLLIMLSEMVTHGRRIFVRARTAADSWSNVAIADMTATQAMAFMVTCVERWMQEPGYRPVRLLTDEEMAAKKERS